MSIDRGMDKEDVILLMEYYSATKKNERMAFAATWMDQEIVILSEVSQRKTSIIWYHLNMESEKWYQQLIYKTETDSLTLENYLVVTAVLVAKSCLTLLWPHGLYAACQSPLSMEFPRQEYWSGLPFPSPGDLPDPGIKPSLLHWHVDSLPLSHLGSLSKG